MKKVISLTLCASLLALSAAASPSAARSYGLKAGQQPSAEAAARAKAFHPLVPTRSQSGKIKAQGLSTAPEYLSRMTAAVKKVMRTPAKAPGVSEGLKLRGSVVSTYSFMYFPGLYYIPTTADESFEQIPGANIVAEYGAWDDGNGKYYVGGIEDWGIMTFPLLFVYNTDTWEEAADAPECDHSILCTDNATDPTTGDVYGCYYYYDEDDNQHLAWAKADYPAGKSDCIRVLGDDEHLYGVACDAKGQYYGILSSGDFVKIDKTTGVFTTVANTGLRPFYGTAATFDDKSGNVIFSYAPAAGFSSLWSIEPDSGTASLVLDFENNDQVTALEVMKPAADDKAPATPVLSAEAPDGGMVINYTIAMPTTTFDGSEAEGELSWNLTVDGVQAGSGASSYGQTVTGSYTVETEGVHTLVAYAENQVGRSPVAKLTVVNGNGVPKAPEGLGINNFGGGEIGLYWDAVTESTDGAFVDPAAITYTVKRNGETVAEGLTDTWFDETVTVPDTYLKLNYEVTAVFGRNESEAATVSTGVGAIVPPYACNFTSEPYDSDLYTSIDVNEDEVAWYFSPYYNCFKYDYGSNAGDDWLITPAFYLEAGKIYEFSFKISGGHTMYTERYALSMGVAPTAQAMVTELIPPTELVSDGDTPVYRTVNITPATSGNYYLGWHALSDASMFMIRVSDVVMSAPMTEASPAEATALTLVPDAEGHLKLHGSFAAPAVDISGNKLTSLGKVTVTRGGKSEPVAEFASPAPGALLEFDDNDIPELGTYTYYVNAETADGIAGREAKASVYVGPVKPVNVPEVHLTEGTVPGTAVLSWDAPETDVNGNAINPANLTYMVYVAGEYNQAVPVLDEAVAGRELTFKVCEPGEKAFATFYVSAFNLGLESEGLTRSPMVPVGASENLPYSHSFNEADRGAHLLGYVIPSGSWATVQVSNREDAGVAAQDGDDAFIKINNTSENTFIDFFTGKIDLSGVAAPAVSLYHYVWSGNDANTVEVFAVDKTGTMTLIGGADHAVGAKEGWNLLVCPLDKVKDQTVYILVRANFVSHSDMLFDALRVADMLPVDLAATMLTVPGRVEVDKEFKLAATVANTGRDKAEGYTVELLLNGEKVDEARGPVLESGAQADVEFLQTLSPLVSGKLEYSARVVAAGDGDESNNISPVASPELVASKFPAVSDLTAQRGENGVDLSWTAPSTAGYEAKEVEDFEDAQAWTEEVEGWTMLDRDGQQIGALEGAAMPDAVAMRTRHSFYVFDNESDEITFFNPELTYLVGGNSGSKSLVAMYVLGSEAAQDDWAISPLLSGEAQTISFYARRFHPEYPDYMEVLYTMEDTVDPDKYVSLCPDGSFEVPQLVDAVGNAAYKLYEFELPEGAKHFALRACNLPGEGFMLMIDDVKFRPANATLEVLHYDIYRDGVKINATPLTATVFTDSDSGSDAHVYNVVVTYNRGLSPASNTAEVAALGVGDTFAAGVRVAVVKHEIVVSGAGDSTVRLYGADGRRLYESVGDCRISAAPGVYVISVGNASVKAVVK